jgi:hypothetical protein
MRCRNSAYWTLFHCQCRSETERNTYFALQRTILDFKMPAKSLFTRLLKNLPVIVTLLYLCWLAAHPALAQRRASRKRQTVDLTPVVPANDLQHVKVIFELQGTLALKSDAQEPVERKVQAKAQLAYDEKVIEGSTVDTPWATATVRHYETAKAKIQFESGSVSPQLRDDRRIVGVSATSPPEVVLYSPLGPLTRDELDLIDVPANSAIVDSLLPRRTVAVGQSWTLKSELLADILGIDAIGRDEITCKLDRIDGKLAIVHAKGSVSGASGGVATEITLAAKFSFDMTRQRISWFAMSLKENRSVGHAQPGIEATVRVQMALSKRVNSPALHEDILADLNLNADPASRLLRFTSSSGGFELLLERNWHEMVDRQDVSVLRLVDRGDLIAQCNISSLPPMEDGVPFTLADLQKDVKNVLDENLVEFISATESINDNGLHVMRVVASGKISELDIQWVYYHITNEQGQRASCVFTFEADLADRFGAADQATISSFRFLEKLDQE